MYHDLALTYDQDLRRCDLTLGDDYDLAIDDTSITPILMSLGLDRRAAPDDPLPAGISEFLTPSTFVERRGAPGDALDRGGELTGSKDWLLDRAKENETTRMMAEYWSREALSWASEIAGREAVVEVWWAAPGVLARRAQVDGETVTLSRKVT